MLNNFKWYRKFRKGSWYKLYYQLPEGDLFSTLDKQLVTHIKWDRFNTPRGFGIFKILKQEHYD